MFAHAGAYLFLKQFSGHRTHSFAQFAPAMTFAMLS